MKKLFTALLMCLVCSISLHAQQIYASKVATGTWGSSSTWEVYPGGTSTAVMDNNAGTAAVDVPNGSKHIYVRSGHKISMDANQACYSLIVASGGALVNGTGTTSRRLYVSDGGGSAVYPINATITNNGTIGGDGDDGRLYIEPGAKTGTVTFTGNGVYNISRIRIQGGKTFGLVAVIIDADMTMNVNTTTDAYGLSAVHVPAATDNYSITINAGKTVIINGDKAYFNNNTAGSGWGTYTYNINGTLDLSANLSGNTSLSPAGGTMNLNVNGSIVTGKSFRAAVNAGIVNLRVNNGGLIDASLAATAFATSNAYPFVLTGSGTIKRTALTNVATLFPVATGAATYNPITINNSGVNRIFSVTNIKNSVDNPPASSYISKQWNITSNEPVSSPVSISLGWTATDQGATNIGTTPAVIRYNGAAWETAPSLVLTGAGTQGNPYSVSGTYSAFGNFIIGDPSSLPAGLSLSAQPTFHSCSIYYPSATGNSDSCKIAFRKLGQTAWADGLSLVFDTLNQQYRGSLVRLEENTAYDVLLTPYKNGAALTPNTIGNAFTTWNPNPAIGSSVNISTYITANGGAVIENISGTAMGWVKITASSILNAPYVSANNAAVSIKNCHYVILDGITIKGGYKHGIDIDNASDNIRILNCNISNFGRIPAYQGVSGTFYDVADVSINHDAGINMASPYNVVVERCYVHDAKGYSNPWWGVMELPSKTGQTTGWVGVTRYADTHPEGTNAVFVNQARGGVVLRYNDFVGSQTHRYNDPVESAENGYVDGGFNKDCDIYGNMIAFGQDDGIELDGGQCNMRVFDNRFEQTMVGLSMAPNKKGPSYIFNNLVYNLGNKYASASSGVKNGGGTTHSIGKQFFFNNTILSRYSPFDAVGYGSDANRSAFKALTRNNIFTVTNLPAGQEPFFSYEPAIYDQYPTPATSFDYDMLGNSAAGFGNGIITAAAGNEANGLLEFPTFSSLANGVFTLKGDTNIAINKGVPVPNFASAFTGANPDMGAFEYGNNSMGAKRPVDIQADKYYINTTPNKLETVNVMVGAIGTGRTFTIEKAEDMGWLTVTSNPGSGALSSNSTVALIFSAVEMANTVQKGVVFLRLDNGFSIPITVSFIGTGNDLGMDRTRLSNLTNNKGTMTPAFSPEINHYFISVPNSAFEILLSPSVDITNAVITVNGTTTASGGNRGFDLYAGRNIYATARVTRDDSTTYTGKSVKDYFVTIYRAKFGETLPVNLIDFTALPETKRVKLQWSTSTEINSDHFEIRRSTDGSNFTKLAMAKASGQSTTRQSYFIYDNEPKSGKNYYQLIQFDKDGRETNFGIRMAEFTTVQSSEVAIYPDPADKEVTVKFNEGIFSTIQLVDLHGKIYKTFKTNSNQNMLNISLNGLAAGTYWVKLVGHKHMQVVKKLVKL